ncbi:MAG: hypothetical protein JRJ87_27950 [Deltaproteobacteria bacterium]|nr:hypothetical protein [Deltaproteobacteria bacterium]
MKTEIELDGRKYSFDRNQWVDTVSFQVPPLAVQNRLDYLLAEQEDMAKITDFDELMKRAKQCRLSRNYQLALKLTSRALQLKPDNLGTCAVVCSIYREMKQPDQALALTDKWADSNYPPLLTSRAAALCDLERWEEAKKLVGRVLARKNDEEAFMVVKRIKAARPGLYKKK